MRKFQNLGAALAIAGFVAVGMVTSSARLEAFGPGNGNSQTVLCALAQRAIDAAIATFGADSELVAYLQAQYLAAGCGQ